MECYPKLNLVLKTLVSIHCVRYRQGRKVQCNELLPYTKLGTKNTSTVFIAFVRYGPKCQLGYCIKLALDMKHKSCINDLYLVNHGVQRTYKCQ